MTGSLVNEWLDAGASKLSIYGSVSAVLQASTMNVESRLALMHRGMQANEDALRCDAMHI